MADGVHRAELGFLEPLDGDEQDGPVRIPVRFGRVVASLSFLVGLPPSRCYVEATPDELEIVMGWAFRARIPVAAIASAHPGHVRPWEGIGVHGWRGTWVVNGSLEGIVEIRTRELVPARVMGLRVGLRRLLVAVEDPGAVLAALRG